MFSKLLKHEWKANFGMMGILALAVTGLALVGTIILRVLVNYGDLLTEGNSILALLLFPMGMLVFVSFLGLAIYAAAVIFVLLFRFYKNKFTDEGYLTFTLPVKTHHIFISSALNMVIWMVISVALVVLLFGMMILCGTSTRGLVNMELIRNLQDMQNFWEFMEDLYRGILGDNFGVLALISIIITPVYSAVLGMSCITLGAVVAKKHKILASIGIYYGTSVVLSIVSSVITTIPSMIFIGSEGDISVDLYYTLTMIAQLVIYVGVIVGGYFLSTSLMKKKLNLP